MSGLQGFGAMRAMLRLGHKSAFKRICSNVSILRRFSYLPDV
jgi:hypothetical protein